MTRVDVNTELGWVNPNGTDRYHRIVLIGFSGTGKSTVARELATRLGWAAHDIDEEIEARLGRSIPEIFATDGEPFFRSIEGAILDEALATERVVIATGGGAVVAAEWWSPARLCDPHTLVVALDASANTILHRLRAQAAAEGERVARPMLAGDDPLARITSLKTARQAVYDRADLTLVVDRLQVDQVVDEIEGVARHVDAAAPFLTLDAVSGQSVIYAGSGVVSQLAGLIAARWPTSRRMWLAADANVAPTHGERVAASLRSTGVQVQLTTVPPGEGSKSLVGAGALYDWLLDGGVERGDVVVALGGGVVGDLVGFVAATCLRGVGLVQVPTTLLAMVDSSVGGKTGINHRAGKNLIGAFYQPPLVVIDPDLLATLPAREITSGWAEIVKHAVIQPSTPGGERGDLLPALERMVEPLRTRREPALSWMIRRNVALKAAVVAADERESGMRAILNFGHTFGHAIEASGYELLHGEAVSVGMAGAIRLSQLLGMCEEADVARLERLLTAFGLPIRAAGDPAAVLQLMRSDKKRIGGRQRWILPTSAAGVEIRSDVADDAVAEALAAIVTPR
ncbi:MAG: 3-dehydroquinate synthase [Chloroflexota bacterium]|nr:3-dehydroquinate synthase [Chloroflexota bacterium]